MTTGPPWMYRLPAVAFPVTTELVDAWTHEVLWAASALAPGPGPEIYIPSRTELGIARDRAVVAHVTFANGGRPRALPLLPLPP